MLRHLKIIFLFIYFFSCVQLVEEDETTDPSYIFEIEPNLPIDDNGYYHLTINRNNWQTTHRIDGRVTDQEGNPVFYYWVEWESDLYWYLGDTLGYIVNRYLNNSGVYVSVDTSYIVGFNGQEVKFAAIAIKVQAIDEPFPKTIATLSSLLILIEDNLL